MPFYSLQDWALPQNEELQFKSVSVLKDANLKLTAISKRSKHIKPIVQNKTDKKQVRLILLLKLSEQKKVHL